MIEPAEAQRLELAQGDAGPGPGGLPRGRAGPAPARVRGTTGWDGRDDDDAATLRTHTYALDAVRIVYALGRRSAAAAVGHDLGAMVPARWVQREQPQRSNAAPLGFHRKPDSAP
ncbi:hypothetical protein R1A27_29895 (plasmid) [Methylobacterium sp. NMS12]|uniref:hypothetical protein n=1 Tax=Methylobacterium sp. NMS12 TaxID=3079766 RepID=UPI003F885C3C